MLLMPPDPNAKPLDEGTLSVETEMADQNWLSGKIEVDVTQTSPVQLVGVLMGDVNGDWAGPGSSLSGTLVD